MIKAGTLLFLFVVALATGSSALASGARAAAKVLEVTPGSTARHHHRHHHRRHSGNQSRRLPNAASLKKESY